MRQPRAKRCCCRRPNGSRAAYLRHVASFLQIVPTTRVEGVGGTNRTDGRAHRLWNAGKMCLHVEGLANTYLRSGHMDHGRVEIKKSTICIRCGKTLESRHYVCFKVGPVVFRFFDFPFFRL